jgi:hypothetical protein
MATTSTPKGVIFDAATGQTSQVVLTADEIAQREIDAAEYEAREVAQAAKATARTSALAKLAELGLTQEEIAAL